MDREGRRGQDDEEFIKKIAEMLGIDPDRLRNDPSFLEQLSNFPPGMFKIILGDGGSFQHRFKSHSDSSDMVNEPGESTIPTKSLVVDILSFLNYPGIHPLAKAEADLNLAIGYCNLCKTKSINAGLLRKAFGGANVNAEKSDAMLHAGKMTEAMMNYKLNMPVKDSVSLIYGGIRPHIAKLVEGLGKYGTDEGMHEFLTMIVSESGLDNLEGSPVKQAIGAINDRKAGPCISDKLYIDMLTSVYGLLKNVDRQTFNSELRDISNNMKNYLDEAPVSQIISNMGEFIVGCSSVCRYSDADCPGYREKLTASRELLNKAEDDALLLYKDVLCVISYIFDVAASVSGNLSDEEFDNAKLKLYELFRD